MEDKYVQDKTRQELEQYQIFYLGIAGGYAKVPGNNTER